LGWEPPFASTPSWLPRSASPLSLLPGRTESPEFTSHRRRQAPRPHCRHPPLPPLLPSLARSSEQGRLSVSVLGFGSSTRLPPSPCHCRRPPPPPSTVDLPLSLSRGQGFRELGFGAEGDEGRRREQGRGSTQEGRAK